MIETETQRHAVRAIDPRCAVCRLPCPLVFIGRTRRYRCPQCGDRTISQVRWPGGRQ